MVGRLISVRDWFAGLHMIIRNDEQDWFVATFGFLQSVEEAVIDLHTLLE